MEVDRNNIIKEESKETVIEVSKSQNIRLVDVFILSPIMIYAGTFKSLPTWLRVSMIGMGVATAFYNGKNFLKNRKALNN